MSEDYAARNRRILFPVDCLPEPGVLYRYPSRQITIRFKEPGKAFDLKHGPTVRYCYYDPVEAEPERELPLFYAEGLRRSVWDEPVEGEKLLFKDDRVGEVYATGYLRRQDYDDMEGEFIWKDIRVCWIRELHGPEADEFREKTIRIETGRKAYTDAAQRLHEIWKNVWKEKGAVRPEKGTVKFPQGLKFNVGCLVDFHNTDNQLVLEDSNRLWSICYNGRDGDTWDASNLEQNIAYYVDASEELAEEVRQLVWVWEENIEFRGPTLDEDARLFHAATGQWPLLGFR